MTRAPFTYGERRASRAFTGIDVSAPVAGFYRTKLRGGGMMVGIRLFYGPPLDPVTGEPLERSWRWQAHANGEPIDFHAVWPLCAASPIPEPEYHRLCRQQAWAQQHAPDSAYADPRRKRDPLSSNEVLPF
jgi:hypothetical protein